MNKKGFSLFEFCCSLFCFSIIAPSLFLIFSSLQKHRGFNNSIQDIISSNQLIHILNLSNEIFSDGSSLSFYYLGKEHQLFISNQKVILSPGTVIYFQKINKGFFMIENNTIYLFITRQFEEKRIVIGYI